MDGRKLYRINVSNVLTANGLALHEHIPATEAFVGGRRVAIDGASNTSADGWHPTRGEALLAAAEQVLKVAGSLARQAERLQKEARSCGC